MTAMKSLFFHQLQAVKGELMISIQQADFDVGAEYAALVAGATAAGAAVIFVGRVRDLNLSHPVRGMELEHYPGMTEKVLQDITDKARQRWQILNLKIIHRVGLLAPGDQIVFVGIVSVHREDAFSAAGFIMDHLKTRAPFWKKEKTPDGDVWVEAMVKDEQSVRRWD